MLQRVQTIYLLGVIICMAAVFFLPVLNIDITADVSENYYLFGNIDSFNFIPVWLQHTLPISVIDSIVLTCIIIFCCKKRKLQIKLCYLNSIFILLFYATITYFRFVINQNQGVIHLQTGAILPLIALIFNYLALRFIKKDEALIRSMDRLR